MHLYLVKESKTIFLSISFICFFNLCEIVKWWLTLYETKGLYNLNFNRALFSHSRGHNVRIHLILIGQSRKNKFNLCYVIRTIPKLNLNHLIFIERSWCVTDWLRDRLCQLHFKPTLYVLWQSILRAGISNILYQPPMNSRQ